MPGVGKLLKQAQKMQKKIEALEEELTEREFDVTSGGGAVTVKINGQCDVKALTIDPEMMEEDAEFVAETVLTAVQEAIAKSKALKAEEMEKVQAGFQMPGFM